MASPVLSIWKQAPFIRLLPPLVAGITLQWYAQLPPVLSWLLLILSLAAVIVFSFFPLSVRFRNAGAYGIFIQLIILSAGCLITNYKDLNSAAADAIGFAGDSAVITLVLQEPLTEKTASWKSLGSATTIRKGNRTNAVPGGILVYFSKQATLVKPGYGDKIAFTQPLQQIRDAGNPGAFDYREYCRFRQVFFQVSLRPGDFIILPGKETNWFSSLLFSIREWVIGVLKQNIHGKKENGLAEALLIGYKEDLDKTLWESYSNTGVVHVIAISGLHLGLIYGLLSFACRPLANKKKWRWLQPVIIISGLWLFSLLAGGSPSVLRSAVMFSSIVFGELISKKTPMYNNLAASAFFLLCYQPFWLWDIGFQLSYAALTGIVIFMKPIYRLAVFKNRIADAIWKLNAVTISAQLLATPVCLFYFHQFPNYFLIANFMAVPLSSIILMGELLLCAIYFIPPAAAFIGWALSWLIGLMNGGVEILDGLPFSAWSSLQISLAQLILLYAAICGISNWLFYRNTRWLAAFLLATGLFFAIRSVSFYRAAIQQKLIVYQVSGHRAIDLISGRRNTAIISPALSNDPFLMRFHIYPARTLFRVSTAASDIFDPVSAGIVSFGGARIMLIPKSGIDERESSPIPIDIAIISGNPRLNIPLLLNAFKIKQFAIDASNSARNARIWKTACGLAGIQCHLIVDKGAFVMNIN